MASFRPGQVIRFTYDHPPMQIDANTRSPMKEIFVLHTRWGGKVHGIDLKVLSPVQIETLRAVMDPKNNRMRDAGFDKGVGDDYVEKIRNPQQGDYTLDQLKKQLTGLNNHLAKIRVMTARLPPRPDGRPNLVPTDVMSNFNAQIAALKNKINNFEVKQATPNQQDQKNLTMRPLTPMAKQILQRVLPARVINNPRVFYNLVVKPLIGRVDAYRTFYLGRMNAIQVDPRWTWTKGAGSVESPHGGIAEKPKQAAPAMKAKGLEQQVQDTPEQAARREAFVGAYNPKSVQPNPQQRTGQSQGIMAQMNQKSGTNKPTLMPKVTKAPRPR